MRRAFLLILALMSLMVAAPAAYADHPHEDDAKRAEGGIPRDPDNRSSRTATRWTKAGSTNPSTARSGCASSTTLASPASLPCRRWENVPEHPGGGDVAQSRRWDPWTIPGYTNVYQRTHTRTEWINPNPAAGNCPNVPGGCKLYGGADMEIYRNGQPFTVHRTWFNKAVQVYVWNATTSVWEKKHDTGWVMDVRSARRLHLRDGRHLQLRHCAVRRGLLLRAGAVAGVERVGVGDAGGS